MKYKLLKNYSNEVGGIIGMDDDSNHLYTIPLDEGNIDYQTYLAWVDAVDEDGNKLGNTAEPAD